MTSLLPWLEKALGPTAPHKMAHRSAPAPLPVVVFTASGDQGRSVCDSLVTSGRFIVTGITKYPHSIAADSLKAKGVKIVKGDIADTATYTQFLEGQDAAFVNMDYLETFQHLGPGMTHTITLEIRQSVAAVEACKRAGIKHIVYSALDDLPEELHVPHYASKAKAELKNVFDSLKHLTQGGKYNAYDPVVEHIRAAQLPCTILYPSHPYSDILAWDLLRPNESNTGLILAIPAPDDCTIPSYAVEQVGDWVSVAMLKPHKWIGKELRACAERISVTKMAHDLSKLLKVPVDTLHLTRDEFYSQEHRDGVGEAIWGQYRACYEEALKRDPVQSEKIAPRQWSFKQWATQSNEIKEMAQELKVEPKH